MELFNEAYTSWNVEQLYQDLTIVKGKPLTNIEKTHIRGLLCGLSPREIAQRRKRLPKSIEVDISNTIYRYIKILTANNTKIDSWRNIIQWLQENGYKITSPVSLSIPVQIENIRALLVTRNPVTPPPRNLS